MNFTSFTSPLHKYTKPVSGKTNGMTERRKSCRQTFTYSYMETRVNIDVTWKKP